MRWSPWKLFLPVCEKLSQPLFLHNARVGHYLQHNFFKCMIWVRVEFACLNILLVLKELTGIQTSNVACFRWICILADLVGFIELFIISIDLPDILSLFKEVNGLNAMLAIDVEGLWTIFMVDFDWLADLRW